MRNHNGVRLVFLIAPPLFLLLPLSVVAFVLERISQSFLAFKTSLDWITGYQTLTTSDHVDIHIRVNAAPTGAILGITVLAYVISVIGACGIWELRRIEGGMRHQRGWSWVVIVLNLGVAGASIAVLGWSSALAGQERWTSRGGALAGGKYMRETYLCGIDKFYPDESWAGPGCGISVSGL
jgi:hypothetical protein